MFPLFGILEPLSDKCKVLQRKSGGSGISNMTSSYIRGYKIDYKYFRKCWYGFKDIKYYVTILAYYIFRTDLILPCLVLVPQQDSLSWQFFLDFFQQMKQFVVISLFLQNLLLSLIICKFYFKLQLEIFKLELKLKWVVMKASFSGEDRPYYK